MKTNVGIKLIPVLMSGSGTAIVNVGVGNSSVAAAATDTALGSELSIVGLARKAGTSSIITSVIASDTLQVQATFNATGSASVLEAGLFNNLTGSVLAARQVLSSVINVANGDTLRVTWKVQIS